MRVAVISDTHLPSLIRSLTAINAQQTPDTDVRQIVVQTLQSITELRSGIAQNRFVGMEHQQVEGGLE